MKKPLIGFVACSVCDFPDAEVKEDKNGCAYVHCIDCNTQVFTRDKRRDSLLRARIRAIPAPAPEAAAPVAPPPVTVPVTVPERTAPPTPPKTTPPVPAPAAPAKSTWLTTLLDGDCRK